MTTLTNTQTLESPGRDGDAYVICKRDTGGKRRTVAHVYNEQYRNLFMSSTQLLEACKVALDDIQNTIETDVLAGLVASFDDHGLAATHRILWLAVDRATN